MSTHTPEPGQRCEATILGRRVQSWQCSRKAAVVEGGKSWCKQHAPSTVKARIEAQNARWDAEQAAREKHRVKEEADRLRADACVAACAGMADPAKEIAELRAEVYRIPPGQIEYASFLPNGQTFKQYAQEVEHAFNLLAIIHGDGGHYVVNHGIKKAVDDAIAKVYELRADAEKWRSGAVRVGPTTQAPPLVIKYDED